MHKSFISSILFIVSFTMQMYAQNNAQKVLVPYLANHKYGLCDTNGVIIVAPKYDELSPKYENGVFTGSILIAKKNVSSRNDKYVLEKRKYYILYQNKQILETEQFRKFYVTPNQFIIADASQGDFMNNQEYDRKDSNGNIQFKTEKDLQDYNFLLAKYGNVSTLFNWKGKNVLPLYARRIDFLSGPSDNYRIQKLNNASYLKALFLIQELGDKIDYGYNKDTKYSIIEFNCKTGKIDKYLAKNVSNFSTQNEIHSFTKASEFEPKKYKIEINGTHFKLVCIDEVVKKNKLNQEGNNTFENNISEKYDDVPTVIMEPKTNDEDYEKKVEKKTIALPTQFVYYLPIVNYTQVNKQPYRFYNFFSKDTNTILLPENVQYSFSFTPFRYQKTIGDTLFTYSYGVIFKKDNHWDFAMPGKPTTNFQFDSIVSVYNDNGATSSFLVGKKINNQMKWAFANIDGKLPNSEWCDSFKFNPHYARYPRDYRHQVGKKQWIPMYNNKLAQLYHFTKDSLLTSKYDDISYRTNSVGDIFSLFANKKYGFFWQDYGKNYLIKPIFSAPIDTVLDYYNGYRNMNMLILMTPETKEIFYALPSGKEFKE